MKNNSVVYLLTVMWLFGVSSVEGIYGGVTGQVPTSTSVYSTFASFGFLPGGTAAVTVVTQPNATHVGFYICEQSDYLSAFNYPDAATLCDNWPFPNTTCTVAQEFYGKLNVETTVSKYGVYYLAILNCDTPVAFEVEYELMNPGGEHLGFGLIPLPPMYLVILVLWCCIAVSWVFNWIKNRNQRAVLHRVISIYPVSKIVLCVVAYDYWHTLSRDGSVAMSSTLVVIFVMIALKAMFYCILLIIASGWGITKDTIGTDKYYIAGVIFLLILSQTVSSLFVGLLQLLTVIMYVVIVATIFKSINQNLRTLEIEGRNVPPDADRNDRTGRNALADKDKMFRNFKIIMTSYLTMIVVILLVEILFMYNYPWVDEMLTELLEMMMFICIGWTFRLRSLNIYYRLQNEDSIRNNEPVNNPRDIEMSNVQTHN